MADFLDSMAGYMALSEDKFHDSDFEGELSYYNNLDGVKIDPQISSLYNKAVSKATAMARNAKSTKSSIRGLKESIEQQQDSLSESKERLRDTYRQIREAKKAHQDTMPFSEKAKQCKQKIDSLKRQFKTGNKKKRQMIRKIKENQGRLSDKKKEMIEQNETVKTMQDYRDKLVKSTRNQFKAVNKIQATVEYIKAMDLNAPGVDVGKINHFLFLTKNSLKVSLTKPLTDKSSDIMAAFNSCIESFKPAEKKEIDAVEQKRIDTCKGYIKQLKEFKMPDEPTR